MMATTYTSPYKYSCSNNHWIEGPQLMTRCPAVVKGSPCDGVLFPANQRARDHAAAGG